MELVFVLLVVVAVLVVVNVWLVTVSTATRAESDAASPPPDTQTYTHLLEAVLDTIPQSLYVMNADGQYVFANKRYYEGLGVTTRDALISKRLSDVLPPDTAAQYTAEDAAVLSSGKSFSMELPREMPDASQSWSQISKLPLRKSDGTIDGLVGSIQDITQSKILEADLYNNIAQLNLLRYIDTEINSTLDMNYVALAALDTLMRLSIADAGFVTVLEDKELRIAASLGMYKNAAVGTAIGAGYGIVGRVIAQQTPQLVLDVAADPDYVPDIATTKAMIGLPLLSNEQLVGTIVLETSRPARFTEDVFQFAQLLAWRVAIAIDNARLYGLVRQKLAEKEQLYEATNALLTEKSKLEQLKTDMIRIASHDLRNPLAVMQGYISMLQMDADKFDDATRDYLSEMERSTRRMTKILQDILSVEKIEQRARSQFTPFDFTHMIERVYEEYLPQATERGQHLTIANLPMPSVTVRGDEDQLYEALANLVGNAIKYTPDAGSITLSLGSPTPDSLIFRVSDNGYGIPENLQARLFQPFYRAKTDETRSIEGTGLGLHLVRNIIERHNGTMLFESQHGKGSMFGFELPCIPTSS